MISFISRVNNLFPKGKCMLKPEIMGFGFCPGLHRTPFVNKCVVLNVLIYKQKTEPLGIKNYHSSENIPKNFGKIVELDEDLNEVVANNRKINKGSKKKRQKIQSELLVPSDTEEEIENETQGLKEDNNVALCSKSYKSMDKNSYFLSSIMLRLKNKKFKGQNTEFVLEGKKSIREALNAGVFPGKIFFTRASDLEDLPLPSNTPIFRIPYKDCRLWADSVTPQGILGIFRVPCEDATKVVRSDFIPLIVVCDKVKDPSNLGAIIRVAACVGCEKLILTKGCSNIWEAKVLRAGAGAHFHVPISTSMTWTEIEDVIDETSEVFVADSKVELDNRRENEMIPEVRKSYEHLPRSCYFSLEIQKKPTVLVVGGESHGLSDEAYEFASKRNGTRVFVPISRIESLNVAVALGILAFDFKRQMSSISQKVSNANLGSEMIS